MQAPYTPVDEAITKALRAAESELAYYPGDEPFCAEMREKWNVIIDGLRAMQGAGRVLFR